MEHIFNTAVTFDNIINLCEEGGTILHILPSNQWIGHGFYQFSPDLFYSVYSSKRGFDETEVFLYEKKNLYEWYKVPNTFELKKRLCFETRHEAYVIVKTVKLKLFYSPLYKDSVQQSDYFTTWENGGYGRHGEITKNNFKYKFKTYIKNNKLLHPIAKTIKTNIQTSIRKLKNPDLISNHKELVRENIIDKIKKL